MFTGSGQFFTSVQPDATVTYTDNASVVSTTTTFTFSAAAIGTATSDRKIVVGVWAHGHGGVTLNSVTVGGVSASSVVSKIVGDGINELWQADVPSGTTGDVVATFSSNKAACSIIVWAVTGAASAANATGTSTADPLTASVTIPAKGIVIGRAICGSSATFTWTNVTENAEYVANTIGQGGASLAYADLQTNLAITADQNTGAEPLLTVASWGPA